MLTDLKIKAAKPRNKSFKISDSRGLHLLVKPNGSRLWRLKYRIHGREKVLALGIYPDVSLALARERCDEARRHLATGIDPAVKRKAEKSSEANTFEALAREWLALQKDKLAASTFEKAEWTFETLIFPFIGSSPIQTLRAPDILAMLKRVEARGKHETAHRAKQRCGQIFRYAVVTGRCEHDVTSALRGALAPVVTKSRAAITEPARIGELLRAIDAYQGNAISLYALKLAPYLFVRPGELRGAQWSEFDLENAEWRIPAERMKMREAHIVPLANQVVGLLKELRPLARKSSFLFPSLLTPSRPMSDNTVNAALRRLGYGKEEMCGHGFRALASTCLNEQGWHPDLIELQLAHAERNKVRAAYNRAQRLSERRRMMQEWADYLDKLRAQMGEDETLTRAA